MPSGIEIRGVNDAMRWDVRGAGNGRRGGAVAEVAI